MGVVGCRYGTTTVKREHGKKLVPQPEFTYTCNGCKQVLMAGDDEIITVNHQFGYGSKHDLEEHELHLCEECFFDKLVSVLKVKPDVQEYIIGEGSTDVIPMKKAIGIANMVNKIREEGSK